MAKPWPEVLYEDNHIIAVNKRSGDISQGDKTGDTPLGDLVKMYIKEKYNKPGEVFLGTIHRIDRPTSGIVVFAKTSKALSRMNKLFHDRDVQKTYWAVVKEKPTKNEDTLIQYMKKNQKLNKSMAFNQEQPGTVKAELKYKLIKTLKTFYLLEIYPKTGRHHQIRVQLSHMGCPIKGDVKYGFDRPNRDASIHLHARAIEFMHPVSKEPIKIVAPPPMKDVIWKACTS